MRRWLFGLLAVVFCLGVILTRVFWDGRKALAAGEAALARDDTHEAIASFRRAARWYAPLAPHVTRAYERLESVARNAEKTGDSRLALEAWQAIRSSVMATRSTYVPFPDKLTAANERIAALMARLEGENADPGKSEAERKAWHLDLLSRDEAPKVGWSLVAILGLCAWVGGGFFFAWRGISDQDRLVPRAASHAGIVIVLGLIAWVLGLYKA
ncbi:MAG: hypothetical protein HY698_20025 [Deltaproteobacteria bacterium]|nr:hypothetical protein [Deltaproteobacteria bacterium]